MTTLKRLLLTIRQLLCRHKGVQVYSGYDLSETVCENCGLRTGVLGSQYGVNWNDRYKKTSTNQG